MNTPISEANSRAQANARTRYDRNVDRVPRSGLVVDELIDLHDLVQRHGCQSPDVHGTRPTWRPSKRAPKVLRTAARIPLWFAYQRAEIPRDNIMGRPEEPLG